MADRELFTHQLEKYDRSDWFSFKPHESLEIKCNAPTNYSGVYMIYSYRDNFEELIYIGSSGQMRNGVLTTRQSGLGGMKDRLVNGYHPKFGKIRRKKAFPEHMKQEGITQINIYWWVTWDETNKDVPTEIEGLLKNIYFTKHRRHPIWHK